MLEVVWKEDFGAFCWEYARCEAECISSTSLIALERVWMQMRAVWLYPPMERCHHPMSSEEAVSLTGGDGGSPVKSQLAPNIWAATELKCSLSAQCLIFQLQQLPPFKKATVVVTVTGFCHVGMGGFL